LDRASKPRELKVKEALNIHVIPEKHRFNQDGGLELSGCWIAAIKNVLKSQ